jgi:hypothetical protein
LIFGFGIRREKTQKTQKSVQQVDRQTLAK